MASARHLNNVAASPSSERDFQPRVSEASPWANRIEGQPLDYPERVRFVRDPSPALIAERDRQDAALNAMRRRANRAGRTERLIGWWIIGLSGAAILFFGGQLLRGVL